MILIPSAFLLAGEVYPVEWPLSVIIRHEWWLVGWMVILVFTFFWIKTSMLRTALRIWINHNLDGGEVRLCAGCGYDLRGCPGDECSECGETIPYKTKEWINRQGVK